MAPALVSPVSNGGRGLKHRRDAGRGRWRRLARQQWRAWVETVSVSVRRLAASVSPVSNGGRGLKHQGGHGRPGGLDVSPVSNGGRGLKLDEARDCGNRIWSRPSAMAGVG